jgi:hypothetical protein
MYIWLYIYIYIYIYGFVTGLGFSSYRDVLAAPAFFLKKRLDFKRQLEKFNAI